MNMPEYFRTRMALAVQKTGSGAQKYVLPTPGVNKITVRALVTMGNAADLVLSLKYADDASGTNADNFPVDVPLYVDGARKTDAKACTIGDPSGNFIVDFVIDPGLVPADKYVGISYATSHDDNLMCSMVIEDVAYKPTAS